MSGKKLLNIVIISSVLVYMLSYFFAIEKTMSLRTDCTKLQRKVDSAQFAPQQIQVLSHKIAQYTSVFGNIHKDSTDFQSQLIKLLGEFTDKENMSIQTFPTPHYFLNDNLMLTTYQFKVSGLYTQHIKLLHELEQRKNGARVVSVNFESKKNIRTKKTYLYMTVYIQKIKYNETGNA